MTHVSWKLGQGFDFVHVQQESLQNIICNLEKKMDKFNKHRMVILFNEKKNICKNTFTHNNSSIGKVCPKSELKKM